MSSLPKSCELNASPMTRVIPNILTIAGVDPSGGAGILADVKTISALGGYACAVVDGADCAEHTRGHRRSADRPGVCRRADRYACCRRPHRRREDRHGGTGTGHRAGAPSGCRTGAWRQSSSTRSWWPRAAMRCWTSPPSAPCAKRCCRWPRCMTPNLPEAGVLLEARAVETVKEMYRAAEQLRVLMRGDGVTAGSILKGGHFRATEATDLLHDGDRMIELRAARVDDAQHSWHGLHVVGGARDAAAARTQDVVEAARLAKAYLTRTPCDTPTNSRWASGHGPVHHFHALWQAQRPWRSDLTPTMRSADNSRPRRISSAG